MIDLIDLTCPTPKENLGDNDRVLATDGNNVFLVKPSGESGVLPDIENIAGGFVGKDDLDTKGLLSIEDFFVFFEAVNLGIQYKNDGFTNIYTENFSMENVLQKLTDRHYIPIQPKFNVMEIAVDHITAYVLLSINNEDNIGSFVDEQTITVYLKETNSEEWIRQENLNISYSATSLDFRLEALAAYTDYDLKVVMDCGDLYQVEEIEQSFTTEDKPE